MYRLTIRNLMTLVLGGIIGQGAMFAAFPILTFLYSPAEIGRLAVFTSTILLILPVVGLRFEIAIPLAHCEEDAARLSLLSLISCTVIGLAYVSTLVTLKNSWSVEVNYMLENHASLITICLWSAGLFTCAQYIAIRERTFSSICRAHSVRGLLGAATQLILGYIGIGTSGLLIGQSIYMGIGAVALSTGSVGRFFGIEDKYSLRKLLDVLRRYWRYPLVAAPEGLISAASTNLPPLFIVALSGIEIGGLFYLAQKITSMPVALISSNMSKIYLSEARLRENTGELTEFSMRIFKVSLSFGFVLSCTMFLLAKTIAPYLTGSVWHDAAFYTVLLIPSMLLQISIVPVAFIMQIKSKHIASFLIQVCGLLLQVGSVLLCYVNAELDPVAAFAVGSAVHYLLYTTVVIRACHN